MKQITDVLTDIFAESEQTAADSQDLVFPVKICGLISCNGRKYPETVLAEAVKSGLYEGAPLCLDSVEHKTQGQGAGIHLYERRVGLVENTVFRPGKGVFGNAVLNPKHVYAESLAWDMQRRSKNLGLSQVIVGEAAPDGTITKIERVRSVDVTLYPATTKTFSESEEDLVEDAELASERAAREAEQLDRMVASFLEHTRFQQYMTTLVASLQPVKAEAAAPSQETIKGLIREVLDDTQPTVVPESYRPGAPDLPAPVPAWQPPSNSPIQFVRR